MLQHVIPASVVWAILHVTAYRYHTYTGLGAVNKVRPRPTADSPNVTDDRPIVESCRADSRPIAGTNGGAGAQGGHSPGFGYPLQNRLPELWLYRLEKGGVAVTDPRTLRRGTVRRAFPVGAVVVSLASQGKHPGLAIYLVLWLQL